jgi:acylphosphatase
MSKDLIIRVYGEVQNVGFRYEAKRKADKLRIFGFVRNETDGSVYVEAQGNDEAVEEFLAWCRRGPSYARIDKVEAEAMEPGNFSSFEIKA